MQHKLPSEVQCFLATQEILKIYSTRRIITVLKKTVIHPYPEPDKSSPQTSIPFFKINFNVSFLSTLRFYKWSISLAFPAKNL
jgi:hypothetical protein